MGDFNINLLNAQTCQYTQNFLFTLQSYALTPTIDKPTRVYNQSATLIDNIFVNKIENPILSGNIVSDISDHFSQFCIIQSDKYINYQYQPNAKIRDYSKFSESKFNDDIAQINWYTIINWCTIDKLFVTFYDKLNKVINKHAPLKPISNCMKKQFSKPWINIRN